MAARKAKAPAKASPKATPPKKCIDKRGAPKGKFKNPPFVPTEQQRRLVMILYATGNTESMIAAKIAISIETLRKYFRQELDEALVYANAELGGVLYKGAAAGDAKKLEMWFDRRGGPEWRKKSGLELSGPNGSPIEQRDVTKLTNEQLAALAALDDDPQ